MSTSFLVQTNSGKVIPFIDRPCFGALNWFAKEPIDEDDEYEFDNDPACHVSFYYRDSKDLKPEELELYLNFLKDHPLFGQCYKTIDNSGVSVRTDINGALMLSALMCARYVDEMPMMIRSLYYLHNVMPDISLNTLFAVSHFRYHDLKRKRIMITPSNGSEHNIFHEWRHTVGDLVMFIRNEVKVPKTSYTVEKTMKGVYRLFECGKSYTQELDDALDRASENPEQFYKFITYLEEMRNA